MRKIRIIFLLLLTCCFAVMFAACSSCKDDDSEKISSIFDIDFYADMQRQADKIDVDFDNATQKGFKFSITDGNEIEEIMDIIFSETLNDLGKQPYPPMGNTSITIYQGEKAYGMSVRFIIYNDRLYAFSTWDLVNKINELATERGAFNGEYRLTVQDPNGYIIEPLQETYRAGETVTVKTHVLFDIDMIAYLNGVSLGSQTSILEDDQYHWEFYFIMPAQDAVLSFKLSGGM